MLPDLERGGGSERKQGRDQRKISQKSFSLQHSLSKRERSEQHDFPSHARKKARKRSPPSIEAMELSDKLKKLSREKKLDEALALFWDNANNNVRDGHHACIMVDMAARCGNIAVSYWYLLISSLPAYCKIPIFKIHTFLYNTIIFGPQKHNLPQMKVGEKLLEKVAKEGITISVETKTALLKVSFGEIENLLNVVNSYNIQNYMLDPILNHRLCRNVKNYGRTKVEC